MDRKLCVLLYSQYSPASNQFLTYIKNLPYDIAQLTGMTMLSVDCDEVRNIVKKNGLTTVPCILIQYFDDTKITLEGNNVYAFVDAVGKSLSQALHQPSPIPTSINEPLLHPHNPYHHAQQQSSSQYLSHGSMIPSQTSSSKYSESTYSSNPVTSTNEESSSASLEVKPKKEDIMAKALAIQKEREKEENTIFQKKTFLPVPPNN